METQSFELLVDGSPYIVKATPFNYNDEVRFKVSYNGSEEFIFARDSDAGLLTAIGAGAATIPDNLEEAISGKLGSIRV